MGADRARATSRPRCSTASPPGWSACPTGSSPPACCRALPTPSARCSRRCARPTAPTEGEWAAVLLRRMIRLASASPATRPSSCSPSWPSSRPPAWRSATSTPTPSSTRSTARRASSRRCPTCARPPAARSWTSRPPSSPTTGTSAGAPGTRPWWSRPAAGRCACARRGRTPSRARSTSRSSPRRRSVPARTRPRGCRSTLLMGLEPSGPLADWGCGSGRAGDRGREARLRAGPRVRRRGGIGRGHARGCARQRRRGRGLALRPAPRAGPVGADGDREPRAAAAARGGGADGAPAAAARGLGAAAAPRRTRSPRRSPRGAWRRRTGGRAWNGARCCWRPGDRLRGRARRRAADRGPRAPHAGADLARAGRRDRRAGVPEGGEPAAGRRVQVPRGLQRGRLAHARRSAPPASPPSPRATTRRRSRSPRRCTTSRPRS